MSPILTRPIREQFEHDRVVRLLHARYRRKYDVVINPGAEQNASVGVGELTMYPDVVLFSQERGRRLQGTIEVETGESINTLEAMAQWGPFSRLRAPFVLYVPPTSVDTVRRLCNEHHVSVAEIWTYHMGVDQVRFTMVHRAPEMAAMRPKPVPAPKTDKPVAPRSVKAKPAKAARKAPARKPAKPVKAKAAKKPAAKTKTKRR